MLDEWKEGWCGEEGERRRIRGEGQVSPGKGASRRLAGHQLLRQLLMNAERATGV